MMVMTFGQLLDHDMQLTPLRQTESGDFLDCCSPMNRDSEDCCPIHVPVGDHFYGQASRPMCIPFLRSKLVQPSGHECRRLPDVENSNSAWIDASFLYGSDEELAL
jgi:hypothetical protein